MTKFVKLFMLVLLISSMSCKKKEVHIPTLAISGIRDTIYNNSQIWIFFENKGNDTIANLNKNNSVANTHWIFNIDKRLTLKHIIPHIQKLQAKKETPSLHSTDEVMHNYYSFLDTKTNSLSLILFDTVKYVTDNPISPHLNDIDLQLRHVYLKLNNRYGIIDNETEDLHELSQLIVKYTDTVKSIIHLSFDKNMTYQNYLMAKGIVMNSVNKYAIIDENEYLY